MNAREQGIARLSNLQIGDTHPEFLVYRSLLSDLKKASAYAHGPLLDLGCGTKPYEIMFAPHVCEHVGCDVVQSSEHRVDVICQANELAFEDATFDTILSTQVIEHVADHGGLISEAYRLLRKNGVFIVSGPMYWPLHEEPYDFFRFTEHGFRFLLESAGFSVVEILQNGGQWALCGQVLIHSIEGTRLARRFVIRAINKLFAYLDDRRPIKHNTMNYVIVARKE